LFSLLLSPCKASFLRVSREIYANILAGIWQEEIPNRLSLALVSDDFFKFHQLLLIKGDGCFLEFSHSSASWLAGDVANPGGRLYRERIISFFEPESHIHQAN
jgi:hypothetical protein